LLPNAKLGRVTSDCRPWPAGGKLCVCADCGCIQKAIDAEWLDDVGRIYAAYDIYHQSGGIEQGIFTPDSTAMAPRSQRLLQGLNVYFDLPRQGRMLEIGCGNGALLRSFSSLRSDWVLVGQDLGERQREAVEAIAGPGAFFSCPAHEVPGQFDLVIMNHVLEHIPDPSGFLAGLRGKIAAGGLLLIQVPNTWRKPFDLLEVDHASHFTPPAVRWITARAGYSVSGMPDLVSRETTVLARVDTCESGQKPGNSSEVLRWASQCLEWLIGMRDHARSLTRSCRLGIFGTSIAGTWLGGELGEAVSFFVDEDRHRVGRNHLGRPILHPSETPVSSHVYMALESDMAEQIALRLAHDGIDMNAVLPPPAPQWEESASDSHSEGS
jgi:SAM-dependent methyltransferase